MKNGEATPVSGNRQQKIEQEGRERVRGKGGGGVEERESERDQRWLEDIDRGGGGRREERRVSSKHRRLGPLLLKRS